MLPSDWTKIKIQTLIDLTSFFTALKDLLLEKQNLLTKTTQELSELGSYKVSEDVNNDNIINSVTDKILSAKLAQ